MRQIFARSIKYKSFIPKKKVPWLKYFFQITIPAFLLSVKSTGQTNYIKGKVAIVDTKKPSKYEETKSDTERIVTGRVVDENGQGIPAATIRIKDVRKGVVADTSGKL